MHCRGIILVLSWDEPGKPGTLARLCPPRKGTNRAREGLRRPIAAQQAPHARFVPLRGGFKSLL